MENFKALTKTLSEIKKISGDIISRTLTIMIEIESGESDFVSTLVGEIPGLQSEQALAVLQDITLDWIKDAEQAKIEVEIFIIPGDDSFKINTQGCPTLSEIWNGDAYDKFGIEGLKEFQSHLKNQASEVSEENLMKKAREMLTGEES